jgi:serine protease Do
MNFLNTIRTRKLLSSTLILFTLSIGIMIGTLINTGVKAAKDQAAPGATPLVIPNPIQLSTAFSQIAKQLEPSVVNISTTYEPKAVTSNKPRANRRRATPNDEEEGGGDDSSMQEFFKKFFGNPGGPFGGSPDGPQGRKSQALGSGVIVDPNGYILTNNHVVEKADRIQVSLAGTTTKYDAKLIGSDLDTDLAVIRIDAHKPLVAAKIGNSDSVQVGDWAVAIGSPFGLQATVTAGIISAKERDLGGTDHQFQKFLQTDAAINRGNSGGPLLAINGDLIGINTAILSESGGSQGVGFALPINTAAKVYNQIIKNGKVTRGAIGVSFMEAKPELLAVYGAKEGVFVSGVTDGMPAAKAGIHPEDVIVEINGKPVHDGQDLVNRISDMPVGSQVKITAVRDKKRQDFMVTVGDRKEIVNTSLGIGAEHPGESAPGKAEVTPSKLGISIENLTPARKQAMGFPENEKGGVLVVEVIPGSFAEDLGLETREDVSLVIASINRQPVMSAEDVTRIWSSLKPGEPVVFHIMQAATGSARRGQAATAPTKWVSSYLAGTVPNQ